MNADAVEAVFLDLDGTICEYCQPTTDLLSRSFDQLGVDPFFTAEEYREQLFAQVVTDETRAERREAAFSTLATEYGHDAAVGRRLATVYASLRDHSDVRPLPGALDALDYLGRQYDLALITNGGPETQDQKLAALDIADEFEVVVYGGYDTTPKPEPGPFHEALYTLDLTPGKVIHVGNSVRSDVWGADAAGIKAALLSPGDDDPVTAPDYVLESMRELCDPPWV